MKALRVRRDRGVSGSAGGELPVPAEGTPRATAGWLVLFSLSVGSVTVALDASILVVSMPRLSEVFRVDPGVISWVNIVYLLASQSLMLTLASLGDFAGRKRIYVFGLVLYTVGLALCSVSTSLALLLLGRAVQGIGAATTYSLSIAIAVDALPVEARGRALGVLTSASSIGLIAGPLVGGLLLQLGGWRAIFYTRIPIALIASAMGARYLAEQRAVAKNFGIDGRGSLVLIGLVSSFLLFLNFGSRFGLGDRYALVFGLFALILLPTFLGIEQRAEHPLLDLALFRKRLFALPTLSAALQPSCTTMAIFLTPFYLTEGLGYSAPVVGIFMAVLAVPHVLFSPVSGRLSDRYGTRTLASMGMVVATFALFTLSRLGQQPTAAAIGFGLMLVGAAIGIFLPANNSAIMGSVPKESLGAGSAVLSMARQVGSSSGMAVAGAVFSARQVHHLSQLLPHTAAPSAARNWAVIASFSETMIVAAIIGGLGILTASMRGSDRGAHAHEPA